MAEDEAMKRFKLLRRVAVAMKNSFVVRGDDATEADDIALQKIKDLVEEIEPEIFRRILAPRNRNRKRLS